MSRDFSLEPFIAHHYAEHPVDWTRRFGRVAPLDVEIGSGYGDYLLRVSQEQPQRNFVGIEMEWERVKRFLRKIELAKREPAGTLAGNNIRILQMDVRIALGRLFLPGSISKLYCLFPCPWPQKKHVKHRLFSPDFLRLVNSRLVPDGEVRIVTDAYPYFSWVAEQLPGTGFEQQKNVVKPQFQTKYERKWCSLGQQEFYELCLVKKTPIEIPLQEDVPLKVFMLKNFVVEKFVTPNLVGELSVIRKDQVYDPVQRRVMVHYVVSEKEITQHLWVTVGPCPQGWFVTKTEGHPVVPTDGIAVAIRLTAEAAAASGGCDFWAADHPTADV